MIQPYNTPVLIWWCLYIITIISQRDRFYTHTYTTPCHRLPKWDQQTQSNLQWNQWNFIHKDFSWLDFCMYIIQNFAKQIIFNIVFECMGHWKYLMLNMFLLHLFFIKIGLFTIGLKGGGAWLNGEASM